MSRAWLYAQGFLRAFLIFWRGSGLVAAPV